MRDALKHFVAGNVSVGVVVGLEVIHIDHQKTEGRLVARAATPFGGQVLIEVTAIRQTRQTVRMREPLQFQIGCKQLLLRLAQGLIRLVALQQVQIRARVIANPRNQLDAIRQLHQVVVGAGGEGRAFHERLFLGRQHDDRNIARRRFLPVLPHEREAVGAGHHEVLQDHRRTGFLGAAHRFFGRRAVMEVDARFVGQRLADRLGDDRLVVDQQHHDRALCRGRIAEDAR